MTNPTEETPELFLFNDITFETSQFLKRHSYIDEINQLESSLSSASPVFNTTEDDFDLEIINDQPNQTSYTNLNSFLNSDIDESINYNSIFNSIISMDNEISLNIDKKLDFTNHDETINYTNYQEALDFTNFQENLNSSPNTQENLDFTKFQENLCFTNLNNTLDFTKYDLCSNTIIQNEEDNEELNETLFKIKNEPFNYLSLSSESSSSLKSIILKNDRIKFKSFLSQSLNNCSKKLKKKFMPRSERVKNALNFYRRRRSGPISTPQRIYRPSFKVEKLLKDSRGMRKYLIDYNCLMYQNNINFDDNSYLLIERLNAINFNDNEDLFSTSSFSDNLDNFKRFSNSLNFDSGLKKRTNSNRCSSGYLSDC